MTPRRSSRPFLMFCMVLGVTGTLLLSACGQNSNDSRSATAGMPDLAQSLTAYEWRLDPSDSSIGTAKTRAVTLHFTDAKHASGSAPCNTFRSTVRLTGDNGIRFTDTASTLMACEPPADAAEKAFFEALAAVRTADATKPNRLVLTGGSSRLAFDRYDPGE